MSAAPALNPIEQVLQARAIAAPTTAGQRWLRLQGDLIARRKQIGLTQTDLATRLGKHPSTIVRWEAGKSAMTGADLFRWADALGFEITHGLKLETRTSACFSEAAA